MTPVAVAFLFAAAVDPAVTLTRVLAKVRADLRRLPNYTCVETITREFYKPIAPVRRDCDVLLEMKKNPTLDMKLRRSHTDRLRLEVAMSGRGEMHAWVGSTRFDEKSIDNIVREGPMGTGMFGAFLAAVFDRDVRSFQFEKELSVDGHDRLVFSFSVPQQDSHYGVRVYNHWVITAYRGTIEIDPAIEEVTHIWIQTAILPPAAGTCRSSSDLEVAMTAIGSASFPLTTIARQRFVGSSGDEAVNTTTFSDCREYRGESSISYYTEPVSGAAVKPAASAAPPPIPAGLPFTTRLDHAIDPATSAAGDRFTARLETSIRDAGGRTLAPRGSKVEGRLLRVQQYHPPKAELIVVLRPESVEVRGVKIALSASQDLRRFLAAHKKNPRIEILLPFKWETNAALLRFDGEDATVPRNWSIDWRTVAR
jgi:hypothetical protein